MPDPRDLMLSPDPARLDEFRRTFPFMRHPFEVYASHQYDRDAFELGRQHAAKLGTPIPYNPAPIPRHLDYVPFPESKGPHFSGWGPSKPLGPGDTIDPPSLASWLESQMFNPPATRAGRWLQRHALPSNGWGTALYGETGVAANPLGRNAGRLTAAGVPMLASLLGGKAGDFAVRGLWDSLLGGGATDAVIQEDEDKHAAEREALWNLVTANVPQQEPWAIFSDAAFKRLPPEMQYYGNEVPMQQRPEVSLPGSRGGMR